MSAILSLGENRARTSNFPRKVLVSTQRQFVLGFRAPPKPPACSNPPRFHDEIKGHPMPIRFYCEKCKFRLRTPDGSAGMWVDCSRCGAKQKVPQVTDPEAEQASENRRAFLAEVQSQVALPSPETRAAYEEPPIEMIIDDQEDVFIAEIADDHDSHPDAEDDEPQNSALTALGRALTPASSKPLPDIHTALNQTAQPQHADAGDALAGLAQQVQSAPKSGAIPPRSTAKPGTKAPARKPAPAPPKRVLKPAPRPLPAGLATRKRVAPGVAWACRIAGTVGIPAAVKVGLVVRDAMADVPAGLAAGAAIGILVVLAFSAGEIADAL
jgi:hypothetical protein